ncbi:MAG TPA: transposase, partial [Dissulfurispiraceae bacterium]|nr:transposase [Dissulfurispiraceae bacterium]
MSRPKKNSNKTEVPTVRIACRYRAYPTDLQQYRMENWLWTLGGLYNSAVAERKETYKITGKSVTYSDQQNALPKLKKADPALRMVHSQVLQDCLQRVDKAYQKFFDDIKRKKSGEKIRVGYPRMKKLEKFSSFTFPQVWMSGKTGKTEVLKLSCDADSRFAVITLPGIGDIKIRLHRPVDWQNAKTVTVKRTSSGDWYVCISIEQALKPKLSDNGKQTGVDVGLLKQVTTSDGSYTEHPKYFRQSERLLKKEQRKLSRNQKGSVNRDKQRIKLAKAHEHVANQRKDFLHKLSFWLVMNYAYIAFEKLNIPGMVRNPHLAKAILDAGWGNLIRYTVYKSVMLRGNDVVRVNPSYSSQDCSICGTRVPKTLSERLHACPNCGAVLDRDHNAA